MKAASLGSLGRSWSATLRHWALAASALSWAKAVADEGGDDAPAALAGVGERVAHGVDAAALPGGVACTLATAALMPSCASEITSLTPRRPRRRSLRRNSVQKVSASEGPMSMPSTSRRPSALTPTAMITATETMRPLLAHFDVGRVEPDIGPVAFERAVEEGLDPFVDLLAQPGDLALRDAGSAHRLDEIVDRARRHALHVGFLDDRAQRLLGHPPRLEEAREI